MMNDNSSTWRDATKEENDNDERKRRGHEEGEEKDGKANSDRQRVVEAARRRREKLMKSKHERMGRILNETSSMTRNIVDDNSSSFDSSKKISKENQQYASTKYVQLETVYQKQGNERLPRRPAGLDSVHTNEIETNFQTPNPSDANNKTVLLKTSSKTVSQLPAALSKGHSNIVLLLIWLSNNASQLLYFCLRKCYQCWRARAVAITVTAILVACSNNRGVMIRGPLWMYQYFLGYWKDLSLCKNKHEESDFDVRHLRWAAHLQIIVSVEITTIAVTIISTNAMQIMYHSHPTWTSLSSSDSAKSSNRIKDAESLTSTWHRMIPKNVRELNTLWSMCWIANNVATTVFKDCAIYFCILIALHVEKWCL